MYVFPEGHGTTITCAFILLFMYIIIIVKCVKKSLISGGGQLLSKNDGVKIPWGLCYLLQVMGYRFLKKNVYYSVFF